MSVAALIVGASPSRLWGLDAHERLRRQLREVGVRAIATDAADLGDAQQILVVNAGFLFELLGRLRRDHPRIELKLHTGDPEHAIARVMAGSEDIAIGALYLASPAASWVTGKVFEIDGGTEATNWPFEPTGI